MRSNTSPEAFINIARSYCESANILYEKRKSEDLLKLMPIYMLYFHSVEIILKAFLIMKGFDIKKLKKIGHKLNRLYKRCNEEGLKLSQEFSVSLNNITSLLDSGNSDMAFRYWNSKSLTMAKLDWVKETVNKLIDLIAKDISKDVNTGEAIKLDIIIGKSSPQG